MGGYPENILNFYKLKKKYGFYIVEDACHALGASYKHKEKTYKVGSCTHSDICVFSFHPVKTITTGEGGLICTNNKRFNEISKKFRNHNISRDKYYWDYNINKTAFNYRLSDLNCALGISQLKKINFFLSKRKKIFKEYNKLLIKNKKFFKFGEYSKNNKPSFHLYILSLKFQGKKSKKKLLQYLNRNKIFPQYHYKPINLFTFSKKLNLNFNDFIGAKNYYKSSISIPLYVDLKLFQIKKICKLILNYLTR